MPHRATIKNLPRAFRMMEEMQAQGVEWGEDHRLAAAEALEATLCGRLACFLGPAAAVSTRTLAHLAARDLVEDGEALQERLYLDRARLKIGHHDGSYRLPVCGAAFGRTGYRRCCRPLARRTVVEMAAISVFDVVMTNVLPARAGRLDRRSHFIP